MPRAKCRISDRRVVANAINKRVEDHHEGSGIRIFRGGDGHSVPTLLKNSTGSRATSATTLPHAIESGLRPFGMVKGSRSFVSRRKQHA